MAEEIETKNIQQTYGSWEARGEVTEQRKLKSKHLREEFQRIMT